MSLPRESPSPVPEVPESRNGLPELAYLMGTRYDLNSLARADAGAEPRFEYQWLIGRNRPSVFDFEAAERSADSLTRAFVRRRSLCWAAAAAASCSDAQAVVATGEDVGVPYAILALLRRRRCPAFIISHGSYLASRKFQSFIRVIRANRSLHFLCLSQSIRDALVQEFGVAPECAHNTSYGIDTAFFQPRHEVSGVPLIVSAGVASRDYRTLVRAVAPLPYEVTIAAASSWMRCSVDITADVLPAHVQLCAADGYLGLRALYAKCSCVVVPLRAVRHACGYAVIAEAMAMGKPVIATRTEQASDFIVDGETGFLVEPGDHEAIRARIEQLVCSPDLAARLGAAARERICRSYSVEAYGARIERVIRENTTRNSATEPRTGVRRLQGLWQSATKERL